MPPPPPKKRNVTGLDKFALCVLETVNDPYKTLKNKHQQLKFKEIFTLTGFNEVPVTLLNCC